MWLSPAPAQSLPTCSPCLDLTFAVHFCSGFICLATYTTKGYQAASPRSQTL